MTKKIITTETLLTDGKYYKQIPCYVTFAGISLFMLLVMLTFVETLKQFLILLVSFGIPLFIPFFYLLGVKKLLETYADINKVKKGKFIIYERKCTDKRIVSNEDTSNDTLILFGEDSGAWVSRKKSKEIKVGDNCYVVYLEGDEKPSMVYSQAKYELGESLKRNIRMK